MHHWLHHIINHFLNDNEVTIIIITYANCLCVLPMLTGKRMSGIQFHSAHKSFDAKLLHSSDVIWYSRYNSSRTVFSAGNMSLVLLAWHLYVVFSCSRVTRDTSSRFTTTTWWLVISRTPSTSLSFTNHDTVGVGLPGKRNAARCHNSFW
jgi:hypothetical protein